MPHVLHDPACPLATIPTPFPSTTFDALQMSFNNSQLSVTGEPTFNNVHGDQVNTRITAEIVHIRGHDTIATVAKNAISEEFDYVKRGHVIGMKDLGSVDQYGYWQNGEWVRRRALKTISTIQVHPNQQSSFTAITYEGKDAQEAWEKDFKQFSRASRTGHFKLFGINRSDIPMLIFHRELIPAAHLFTDTLWMNMYFHCLMTNKDWDLQELWLNTTSGVLCVGPYGLRIPNRVFDTHQSVTQAVPSTVDMLEERSFIAFFSEFGSNADNYVLYCAWEFAQQIYADDLFPETTQDHQHEDNNHPQLTTDHYYFKLLWRNPPHLLLIDVIGGLRFDTVYSPLLEPVVRWPPGAPELWKWKDVDWLVEETQIDGGLTRLDGQWKEVFLEAAFDHQTFQSSWLSQSLHVFDFLKTTGHQESFFVVNPLWQFELSTRCEDETYSIDGMTFPYESDDEEIFPYEPDDEETQPIYPSAVEETRPIYPYAVEETQPIYLFLYPPPMTISELISWMGGHTHFWSFDEDGRSRIPEKEWERWGIPKLTTNTYDYTMIISWPTHIYTDLCKWQIARGFDPSTADWARECGYPEFEIVGAKKDDRFEEIPDQPEKSGWSWLWSAVPGSDISAFAC